MNTFFKRWGAVALLLLTVTVLVYSNSMHGDFHFDDKEHLLENPKIRNLAAVKDWATYNSSRAVLWSTFALNYQANGYDTFGWHVVNLAMHFLNVLLAFFLVRQVFEKHKQRDTIALFSALLFAVHPLQTESVSYIISRSELLMANFFLGSVLCWLRHRRQTERAVSGWAVASWILCALGMWTKESMIVLPVMLVVWEWYFPSAKRRYGTFLPYFVLFALWFGFRQLHLGSIEPPDVERIVDADTYHWTQARVIWRYVWLLLVPVHQNIDPDILTSKGFFEPWVMIATAAHAACLGLAVAVRRRRPEVGLGICWFYLLLAPSSSFMPLKDMMAEHRVYVSALGFLWIFTWILVEIVSHTFAPAAAKVRKIALVTVVVMFTGVFSVLAFERNFVYRDGLTLWQDCIAKSPKKSRPRYNLGNALYTAKRFPEALEQYTKAIDFKTTTMSPYFNRGNTYNQLGKPELAIADFKKVVEIKPSFFQGWYNLGVTYNNLMQTEEAKVAFEKVTEVNPKFTESYNALGIMYFKAEQPDKAIPYFQKVLQINPNHFDGNYNLALCHIQQKQFSEALPYLENAVRIKPEHVNALVSLAVCRIQLKLEPQVTADILQQVVRIKPSLKNNETVISLNKAVQQLLAKR